MARAGGFMPLLRRTPTVLRFLHPSGGVPGGARGWSTDRARCLHRNIAPDRSGCQLRPRIVWLAMRAVTSGPSPAPGTRPPSTPARSRSAREQLQHEWLFRVSRKRTDTGGEIVGLTEGARLRADHVARTEVRHVAQAQPDHRARARGDGYCWSPASRSRSSIFAFSS